MPVPAPDDKPPPLSARRALPRSFAIVAVGRFCSNIALRLVYPFLPRISAGLGVSLGAMGTALAARELVGVSSPVIGRSADRMGHPRAMLLGLVGLATGLLLGGVSSGLLLFTGSLVVITVSKALFDVGSGAWIGAAVPFERRGRAIGLVETTWALSFIIAMPLAGLAMRAGTWRSPFLLASGMCLAFGVYLYSHLEPTRAADTRMARITWTSNIRFAMLAMGLLGVGHQMLVVTFATFLEDEHAVSVTGLGLTAVVFGLAELVGSGAAATFSDRLGQARCVELAMAAAIPASLLLSVGARSLPLSLVLIGVWFTLMEFAIVSLVALFSELDRAARGTAIGLAFGSWGIGHAIGALFGSRLFEARGMGPTSIVMAIAFAASTLTIRRGVRDPVAEDAP